MSLVLIGLCRAEGYRQRVNMGTGNPFPAPDDGYMSSALGDRWIGRDPAPPGGDQPGLELHSQTLSTSKAISLIVSAFGWNREHMGKLMSRWAELMPVHNFMLSHGKQR